MAALMSLILTRDETHEVAMIFSKVADSKRKKIAREEREQNIRQLFSAIRMGDREKVEGLLKRDWRQRHCRFKGRTPLHFAVQSGREDMVSFLIDRGFNVNASSSNDKLTPLHHAIQLWIRFHDSDTADAGADIHATDMEGRGVMHMAARWGHDDLIRLLSKKGVSARGKSKKGSTPLHEAGRRR